MTLVDETTRLLLQLPFEALPVECKARVSGTDYAQIVLSTGGELYLTRYGWALNPLVVPNAWFVDARYRRQGRRLPNSTGTVYRVPSVAPIGATDSIVVKFSRVAQDAPIFIDPSADPEVGRLADTASFNDPFEEIATVMRLRRGPFAPDRPRILTKRPLAIYSAPNRYELWQLGRKEGVFAEQVRALALEKCKFANVVVLNDRKLVAQLDCADPADGDKAILTKISTVQGVVQTNVISVIRPVRP